ncbi:hypothetical protein BD626DRAFT_579512 [Schizophyllum amplum]|uniref:Uncharacterized protein n=1 Tax=Schizophyllum amplum TaxID=97359 RepID=A0A550BRG5_9AGAR|nr:hypothetical protein BD626DRAFT_579512 [Auriculariopsis ampla]
MLSNVHNLPARSSQPVIWTLTIPFRAITVHDGEPTLVPPPTCTTLEQSALDAARIDIWCVLGATAKRILTPSSSTASTSRPQAWHTAPTASHTAPTTPNKTAMTSATNLADTSRPLSSSKPVCHFLLATAVALANDELAVHPVLVVVAAVVAAAVAVAVHTLHAGSGDEAVMAALDRPLSLTTTMHDDAPRPDALVDALDVLTDVDGVMCRMLITNGGEKRERTRSARRDSDRRRTWQRDGDALIATYDEIDVLLRHSGALNAAPRRACRRRSVPRRRATSPHPPRTPHDD